MPIIVVLNHSMNDPLPRLTFWLTALFRVIALNLMDKGSRCFARRIHAEIETAFPLQEADLVGCADPGGFEEGGEEYGAVDAVHVVEVELNSLRRMLCAAGKVYCGAKLAGGAEVEQKFSAGRGCTYCLRWSSPLSSLPGLPQTLTTG